ncbi:MAG: ABC transporter ATP-binding protein [Verrucomicrobia bacterium]|nr:ABC transporter ATP-binding protein [Verrucomicrobiota bacterium]
MKIELSRLTKKFGKTRALDGVDVRIEPGQIVALLGPNGAGKTTLLRCLAGIAAPDEGDALLDSQPLRRDRLDLRRRIMFLPDFPLVYEHWDAIRHTGMMLRLYDSEPDGAEDRLVELLREFDLLPLARKPFAFLSRGQRYKAALVALLTVDPEVWLLDEPFASGMDPLGINASKQHARAAAARGRTVLYSTQILDLAERFSDRVCVIHRGQVRAFDSVANLEARKQTNAGALEELFRQLRAEG